MPGDRYVVATNTDSQQIPPQSPCHQQGICPWGLARYKRWTITIRYDNGEIQTLVEDEFKYFQGVQVRVSKEHVTMLDNNLPLKKHQIHEIVLNVRLIEN